MIAAALFLAAAASPAPVIPFATARSVAYRDCVAAEVGRRSGSSVVQIGRGACARARSRLVAQVYDHIGYGWAATAKTGGQARRVRAHMKSKAQEEVAGFETKLEAWLAGSEGADGRR
jgi:hypothetical protein